MLKVVIDTNLLIDGSEDFYNFANRIIDLVIAEQIGAYANSQTLGENKLLARRKISDAGYLKKLEYFFDAVHPVQTEFIDKVSEDAQDNKILASALTAGADFLITSDNHLLKLQKVHGVHIVRPNEFWSRYEEGSEEGWFKWLSNFIQN